MNFPLFGIVVLLEKNGDMSDQTCQLAACLPGDEFQKGFFLILQFKEFDLDQFVSIQGLADGGNLRFLNARFADVENGLQSMGFSSQVFSLSTG